MKASLIRITAAFALCAALLAALAGCSGAATSSMTIGTAGEGTAAVAMTNAMGKDIEQVFLKKSADKEYGDALSQEGLFAAGVQADIVYPADTQAACDLKLVTADGSQYELKELRLFDMEGATLKVGSAGTSSYLEYTSASTHEQVSILESEQQVIAAQEAKAAAEKAAKKAEKAAKKAKKELKEYKKKESGAQQDDQSNAWDNGYTDYTDYGDYDDDSDSGSDPDPDPAPEPEPEPDPEPAPPTDDGDGEANCVEL